MANLPYDIRANPTYQNVLLMLDAFSAVAKGERTLALVGGGTGIGKTFSARQICRKAGIRDVPEERPTTIDALVSFFWLNRERPVALLDECDHLLRQEMTLNLLKVANSDPRVVAHAAQRSVLNEQYLAEGSRRYREYIAPTRFLLGNRMRGILLSNKNYRDPRVIAALPVAHWNALVGRGIDLIWIPTDGRDGLDLFEYTHHTATEGNMLRSLQFTWEVSRATVRFYVEHIHALVDIHPRRLVMIAQTFRDNPDPDKCGRGLSRMLCDTDQRPRFKLSQTWVAMDNGLFLPERPPPPNRPRKIDRTVRRPHQPAAPNPASSPAPQPATDAPASASEPKPIEQLSGDAAPLDSEVVAPAPPAPLPTVGDRDRVAMLLTTPLPDLAPTLTVPPGDIELSRLTGDQTSVQTALLARSRFFSAVATLTQMETVSLRELAADVLVYLRHTRSTKFWSTHSDSPVNLIMQHAQKLMQANKKKNGAA